MNGKFNYMLQRDEHSLNVDFVSEHEHALSVAHDALAWVKTSECLESALVFSKKIPMAARAK